MGNAMNPSNADIRQFILDTLSDEDFEVFCADYFPAAQADFSAGMSLKMKALRLIEYCQHREWLDRLLAALQRERPDQFSLTFPQAVSDDLLRLLTVPES